MSNWETVACVRCNGKGWIQEFADEELYCRACGGNGKLVKETVMNASVLNDILLPFLKSFAAWVLAHSTIIGGIVVGLLSWLTTGNSSAFWSAVAAGLVAHGGATAGANAAIAAHYKKSKLS